MCRERIGPVDVGSPLKRVGYTDSKQERDEQICAAAALAMVKQNTAAMEKAKATEKVERLRAEAEDKYRSLAATVRIVFPDDHALHQRLRLFGSPSQQRSQNAFLGNAHARYDGVIPAA